MTQKFTDKMLEKLKPQAKIVDIRERDGFGIRVLPSVTLPPVIDPLPA